MSFNIEHYPNKNFSIFSFLFSVDLNKSVKEKLNEGEELTKTTALRILKQIKWKSDILSFLTKPIVLISLSAGLFCCCFFIPPALVAARIFIGVLGGGMLGFSIENSFTGSLSQLSQAYSDQSQRASEYIGILETTDHQVFA